MSADPFIDAVQSGAIPRVIADLLADASGWLQPSRINSIAAELAVAIGGGRAARDIIADVLSGRIERSADVPMEAFIGNADTSWGLRPTKSARTTLCLVNRAVRLPALTASWIADVGDCEARADMPAVALLIAAIKYRLVAGGDASVQVAA